MTLPAITGKSTHWLQRLFYGAAAAACLLLGLIGLVLPIIPGIVFLALAGVLLGKASSRLGRRFQWAGSGTSGQYLRASRALPLADKLRLGGWLLARSTIKAAQALGRTLTS